MWRFVSYDSSTSTIVFLLRHSQRSDIGSNPLPSGFSTFYLDNFKKFSSFYFKENKTFFKGLFRVLFVKQGGTCYKCKDLLKFSSVKLINTFAVPVLMHDYCFL